MYSNYIKRLFDFIISLSALTLIWPILMIVALWLYFANKGAGAFFFQVRPGKSGKIFKVIMFKKMSDERGADGALLPDAASFNTVG